MKIKTKNRGSQWNKNDSKMTKSIKLTSLLQDWQIEHTNCRYQKDH